MWLVIRGESPGDLLRPRRDRFRRRKRARPGLAQEVNSHGPLPAEPRCGGGMQQLSTGKPEATFTFIISWLLGSACLFESLTRRRRLSSEWLEVEKSHR